MGVHILSDPLALFEVFLGLLPIVFQKAPMSEIRFILSIEDHGSYDSGTLLSMALKLLYGK